MWRLFVVVSCAHNLHHTVQMYVQMAITAIPLSDVRGSLLSLCAVHAGFVLFGRHSCSSVCIYIWDLFVLLPRLWCFSHDPTQRARLRRCGFVPPLADEAHSRTYTSTTPLKGISVAIYKLPCAVVGSGFNGRVAMAQSKLQTRTDGDHEEDHSCCCSGRTMEMVEGCL